MRNQASKKSRQEKEEFHWADGIAEQLLQQKTKSGKFTCAAGIAPSGTVHIGHFREIITVDLVARALREKGKQVRFIYSWDNFDRLRKIPANLPRQNLLKDYLYMPISNVPDPFDCHKSYAEHFEKEFEAVLPELGINPEFLYQAKKYHACEYANEIKFILRNKEKVKMILSSFKSEPITENWWPVQIYCEKCNKDTTIIKAWDGNFTLEYECACGNKGRVDFSKKGIVKLPWRIDWPMRWHYEQVDFEPGGKEHSTPGGSRDTAKEIIEQVYGEKAPLYMMYDYIIIKGEGGKMSSSLGNVITPAEALEIYEPQILRYLFVKTRPNTEFAIAFDRDVLKTYAEYDELEQNYFAKKLDKKQKRIYELSQVEQIEQAAGKKPKKIFAPNFRQLVEIVQIKDMKGILEFYKQSIKTKQDETRTLKRAELAKNWLKHAPQEFTFKIQDKLDKETIKKTAKKYLEALKQLAAQLEKAEKEEQVIKNIQEAIEKNNLNINEFFRAAYLIILGKEKGPRLSSLIMLEKGKIINLLEQI
jgi:lysyl-tRNA synthetase class 1